MQAENRRAHWRIVLGNVIFNNDTRAGRVFDVLLSLAIGVSVLAVMLDSVAALRAQDLLLSRLERGFSLLFLLEYILRLITARHAGHYARSFFGLVDLASVLPVLLALVVPGAQFLLTIRVLRLLRVFRIFRLTAYLSEASVLSAALRESSAKITVFVVAVLTLVVLIGTLMYLVEGPGHGFTSIPTSIYWAIVTLTTVGYGDISPHTAWGKALASAAMILGYGIIAVPTGIVTVGLHRAISRPPETSSGRLTCPRCGLTGHDPDARYCKRCGEALGAWPEA